MGEEESFLFSLDFRNLQLKYMKKSKTHPVFSSDYAIRPWNLQGKIML